MKKLIEQTFIISEEEDAFEVKLIRGEELSALEVRDLKFPEASKEIIELKTSLMRKLVKCLVDSPYIFSESNK
jgi:hypothetical protein